MLEFAFMRKALVAGFFLGLVIPLMGVIVINRRTATVGDALSHSSLAGIGLGLILGLSPIIGAIIATILAALSIDVVRKRFPGHGDMATAIVTSTGIGLASIFSDIAPSSTNFESYLFGSIVTISDGEVVISVGISIAILLIFFILYYQLLYISIDPVGAELSGININLIDFIYTIALALTIAIASRIVGVLIVTSLIVVPVACAMTLSSSYRKTVILSMIFGVFFVIFGLISSYYLNLKPGGTIVMTGVISLVIILIVQGIINVITNQE